MLSLAAVCLLASCAASGPEPPGDGSYRLLATSSEGSAPSAPGSVDSATPGTGFGFARWVAFCDSRDPDC